MSELSTTQIIKNYATTDFPGCSEIEMQKTDSGFKTQFREEVLLKWQEKLLSENEILKYERKKYRKGKYENYHKQALISRKTRQNSRIFTYVDKDHKSFPNITPTYKGNEIINLGKRFSDLTINEEQEENNEEKSILYFYIMVDLSPSESLGDGTEDHRILCKIKYDKRGQVIFDPDITLKGKKPYRIQDLIKGNSIYEYTIEVVTPQQFLQKEEDAIERPIQKPIVEDTSKFEVLDGSDVRVIYAGEILSAYNFADNCGPLYIYYQLNLPEGWETEVEEISGVSEVCYPVNNSGRPIYHFSFPFNFSLRRKQEADGWPSFLFSVFSKGILRNDCDEGFASFQLPYTGLAQTVFEINTWRLAETTSFDKLSRYFIGGVHLLKNPSYAMVTNEQKNPTLISRLGLKTESSGTIELRIHSLLQANTDLGSYFGGNEKTVCYHPTTLAVIKAFQKAYIRLKAARQS